jgi:hypothetical protein
MVKAHKTCGDIMEMQGETQFFGFFLGPLFQKWLKLFSQTLNVTNWSMYQIQALFSFSMVHNVPLRHLVAF